MKTYDAMFILPTNLDQPETDKVLESIDAEIKRQDGKHIESDEMGRRSFARSMGKTHEGHYLRMRIEMAPEKVSKFASRLKLNGQIYRVQILVSDGKPLQKVEEPAADEAPARTEAPAAPAAKPAAKPAAEPAATGEKSDG